MKRIEFERLLATKGWRLDGENVRGSSGRILITASQSGVGNIDSYYGAFPKLPHEDKQRLLNWAVKYSLTPIEERDEEKKYYYVAPFGEEHDRYLNYHNINGDFHMNTREGNDWHKTQFTDKEMDEILEEIDDEDVTKFVRGLRKVKVQE